MPARYAVCYAPEPESALANLGRTWLGRDVTSPDMFPQPEIPGFTPERLAKLTHWRRHEGLHCILKPSIQLGPRATESAFLASARVLSSILTPVVVPQLEISVIGKFIALTPTVASRELELLAVKCVRAFESYRQPINVNLDRRYRSEKLTVYQKRMMRHWGYPFVMEEFRFFIPLTDRIEDDDERERLTIPLLELFRPILGKAFPIKELCVFSQPERQAPMAVLERLPFGRK